MPSATTYNASGNREDKTDLLFMLENETTPMLSLAMRGAPPKAMLHEWQADALGDPDGSGVAEGTPATTFDNQAENRGMLSNRVQRFWNKWKVTKEQEMVSTAGVASEKARSKRLALSRLRRGVEARMGSAESPQVGGGAQASEMAGALWFIDSTNTDIPENARTVSAGEGTTSTLTESGFRAALQAVYENREGSGNYLLFANTNLKEAISDFERADFSSTEKSYRFNYEGGQRKITQNVMQYESEWGFVDVILDPLVGRAASTDWAYNAASKNTGILIPRDQLRRSVMQDFRNEDLEPDGSNHRGVVDILLTLVVGNPGACGKFTG